MRNIPIAVQLDVSAHALQAPKVMTCCAGRWAPSQTDVDSMVRSSTPGSQPASCMVVDMGAFNLVEFVRTLGMPAPGLSVTGGVHVLQILSHSLAGRATMFAPLDGTNKVDSLLQLAAFSCGWRRFPILVP